MRIESLNLKNFRCVEEASFRLHPDFTLIKGRNGMGKTSLIDALRVACGGYLQGVAGVENNTICPDDIRVVSEGTFDIRQGEVVVEATGSFPEQVGPISWRRRIPEGSIRPVNSSTDFGSIRNIGKAKYDRLQRGQEDLDLPLIACLGTSSRSLSDLTRREQPSSDRKDQWLRRNKFQEGYRSWGRMRETGTGYQHWLDHYDTLRREEQAFLYTRDAFFNALELAFPYVTQLGFMAGELWLQVNMHGYRSQYLPLRLHSDGIRSFTVMVAELAYRCVVLNGNKGMYAVEETSGIVMIDDIDLGLQPEWQRQVVADLKRGFPKVQFVATTRSPFISQGDTEMGLISLDQEPEKTELMDGLARDRAFIPAPASGKRSQPQ